ncbi:hypothetical protein Mapa_006328 [Marchantia paleacea]|nr:hypothetical protein Mapa_006328 [Marchantia paleacea]
MSLRYDPGNGIDNIGGNLCLDISSARKTASFVIIMRHSCYLFAGDLNQLLPAMTSKYQKLSEFQQLLWTRGSNPVASSG